MSTIKLTEIPLTSNPSSKNVIIEDLGILKRYNLDNFVLGEDLCSQEWVKNRIAEAQLDGKEVDLSGFAEKKEIPIYTSQLINDSDFAIKKKLPIVVQNTGNDKNAVMSQAAVTSMLDNLTLLPYGGSKEWLDDNGDINQLYQIDGYIWAYIDATGWTRTAQQYIIVSNESEMVNDGGIEYLLKNGNQGTVYSYKKATGDIGIPIVERLPETANDGYIVALKPTVVNSISEMKDTSKIYDMGGTAWKYGEKVTFVPAQNKFVPSTATLNARLSGSSASVSANQSPGSLVTDFISVSDIATSSIFQVLLNWELISYDDNKVVFFNSNKARVGNAVISNSQAHLHYIAENDTTIIDLKSVSSISDWSQIAYVRFQFGVHPNTTLTLNEITNFTITMANEAKEVISEEWINTELLTNRRYQAKNNIEEHLLYTNQIPISIDEKKNIVGLQEGYRYNSSDVLTEAPENSSTGFIPVKSGDVIRFKNIGFGANPSGNIYMRFYDSTFGLLSPVITPYAIKNNITTSLEAVCSSYEFTAEGDISKVTLNGSYNYHYMRIGFLNTGVAPIITVNEEILEGTETVTTLEWSDIGAYIEPTEASWNPTNTKYNIIDSLSSSGSSGNLAVYSIDGYLYTYILGASWMQTSKYNIPTLSIDGELSVNSMNAIQNRVVTASIQSIDSKIKNNTNELNVINQKIANIETNNNSLSVPAVWKNAVDTCIAKIKSLQKGKNCVTFPFFSDNHQRNGYAGQLIAYIMKECHIPYCFFGGDSISNGYIENEATMIAQDKAFDTIMSYIPNGRFCRTVGNHDGYWAVSASEKYWYSRDKVYDLFLREESIAQNKHFGSDGTYYYIDDIASKVRWIVINANAIRNESGKTDSNTINTEQLNWIENVALKFNEPGWAVVLISHQPLSNHYHAGINNVNQVMAMFTNYKNSSYQNKADLVGCYSGHIHRDRIYTGLAINTSDDSQGAAMPFTQVTITSDANIDYDRLGGATGMDRNMNGDTSHAIDFITINKDTGTVNITRLGMGNDRSYQYK